MQIKKNIILLLCKKILNELKYFASDKNTSDGLEAKE